MQLENTQPYNNRLQYLQIILISCTILGFEAISFITAKYGSNISVFYRAFYVIVGLLIIYKLSIKIKKRPAISKSISVIVLFWILYILKAVLDTILNAKNFQSFIPTFWLFTFLLCFLPIFFIYVPINNNTLKYAKKTVYALAVFVNIAGFINNILMSSEVLVSRLSANEILNPITFGQTGVILVIMSFLSLISQRKNYKYVNIPLIGLGLLNIAFSNSRGPFLELIIVFIFYFIFNFNKYTIMKLTIFITPILLSFLYYTDYLSLFDNVIARLNGTNVNELRPSLFAESWNRFISNPITGSITFREYAHNIFLGSMEALGFLGGILMLIIYKNAIKQSIVLVKFKSTDWVALLLIVYLVDALISGAIWNNFIFWSMLALASNLSFNRSLYLEKIIN